MLFVRSFVHDEEQKNMTIVVVQNKKICNRSQISESILFFIVIYGIIIMPDCPKRVEEALFFKLKERAFRECSSYSKAYAECCQGRVLSMVWACRDESRLLSGCLSGITSRLEDVKLEWMKTSKLDMSEEDWTALLDRVLVTNR